MKGTIALPPLAVSPSPVLSYICFKVELWLSWSCNQESKCSLNEIIVPLIVSMTALLNIIQSKDEIDLLRSPNFHVSVTCAFLCLPVSEILFFLLYIIVNCLAAWLVLPFFSYHRLGKLYYRWACLILSSPRQLSGWKGTQLFFEKKIARVGIERESRKKR